LSYDDGTASDDEHRADASIFGHLQVALGVKIDSILFQKSDKDTICKKRGRKEETCH